MIDSEGAKYYRKMERGRVILTEGIWQSNSEK